MLEPEPIAAESAQATRGLWGTLHVATLIADGLVERHDGHLRLTARSSRGAICVLTTRSSAAC